MLSRVLISWTSPAQFLRNEIQRLDTNLLSDQPRYLTSLFTVGSAPARIRALNIFLSPRSKTLASSVHLPPSRRHTVLGSVLSLARIRLNLLKFVRSTASQIAGVSATASGAVATIVKDTPTSMAEIAINRITKSKMFFIALSLLSTAKCAALVATPDQHYTRLLQKKHPRRK